MSQKCDSIEEMNEMLQLKCFIDVKSTRKSYLLDEMRVDLDETDFGYKLGEIEIILNEADSKRALEAAVQSISNLTRKLGMHIGETWNLSYFVY